MAFRLEDHLRSGWIDNTVKGTVTGELVVDGIAGPLVLELEGNAWPDLAGCRFSFTNPKAEPIPPETGKLLRAKQKGAAGDITGSQKCRVFLSKEDEKRAIENRGDEPMPETVWKNTLYIEWYSIGNGRVVLQGVDYDLEIDLPRWQLTEVEIAANAESRSTAQTDFLQRAVEGFQKTNQEIRDAENKIDPSGVDEFVWEKRMRENDKRTDALMELLDEVDSPEDTANLMEKALSAGMDDSGRADFTDDDDDEEFVRDLVELDDEGRKICRELEELAGDLGAKHYPGLHDDSVEAGDFLQLVVKSQATASMTSSEEMPGERGFLLARIKREIALAQSVLSALGEDSDNPREELVADVWIVRGLLVDLAGNLRGG